MTEFDLYRILVRPILTERSTVLKEQCNQYVFEVQPSANKVDIRRAVESVFKVAVLRVRTMNVRGKFRRVGRSEGRRPDWKKAIVTLGPGQKLNLLEPAA